MRHKLTENEALVLLNAGKEEGQAYFFNAYYDRVVRFMFLKGESIRDYAYLNEDLIANSFIHLFKTIEKGKKFEEPRHVLGYLLLVLMSEHSARRGAKKGVSQYIDRRNDIASDFNTEMFPLATQSTEATIVNNDRMNDILTGIKALPERCREVIVLLFIAGKSLAETSDILNISISTTKHQRHRGLSALRNLGLEPISI